MGNRTGGQPVDRVPGHLQPDERRAGAAGRAVRRPDRRPPRPRRGDETPPPGSGSRAERKKKAQIQELENLIAALETRLAELARQPENPPADPARVAQLGRDYEQVQREMDEKLLEWEALQE